MVIVHTMVIVHIYIYMNHVPSQPPVPRSDSEEWGIQAEAHQDVIGPHRPAQCSCCQVGGICHGTPGLDRKKEVKDKALFGEHHWGNLCDGILDSVLNEVAMVIGFSLNGVYESAWWQIQFERSLQIWMMTNSVWTEFLQVCMMTTHEHAIHIQWVSIVHRWTSTAQWLVRDWSFQRLFWGRATKPPILRPRLPQRRLHRLPIPSLDRRNS